MKKDRNKVKWLYDQLPRLIEAEVIDEKTANSLRGYYGPVSEPLAGPALVRTFAVVGSLLIGLGIILLFGYNWDSIPKVGKTILAFAPLAIVSSLGAFVLLHRSDSRTWQESVALAIALASAACIGLVSQIYQIDGSLREFYLSWLWLVLPLLPVFRSNSIFLLLSLVTIFWMPLLGRNPKVFEVLSFIAISGSCLLFLRSKMKELANEVLFFAYSISACVGLFSLFGGTLTYFWPVWASLYFSTIYLWASREDRFFFAGKYRITGYVARAGFLIVCLIASFDDSWKLLGRIDPIEVASDWFVTVLALGLLATYSALLYERIRKTDWLRVIWSTTPIVILVGSLLPFAWAELSALSPIIVNLCLLVLGIYLIMMGYRHTRISRLNQGLLIIVIVAIVRFFDSDLSMLYRGIGFVSIGVAFLVSNILLLNRSRVHSSPPAASVSCDSSSKGEIFTRKREAEDE